MRRAFATRSEAATFAKAARQAKRKEGTEAFTLSPEQRIEALHCIKALTPFGASLAEAAEYYVKNVLAFRSSPTIAEAADALVRDLASSGRRERTLKCMQSFLKPLKELHGSHRVSDLREEDIRGFCVDPSVSGRTQQNRRRLMVQFFNFCRNHRWVSENIAERLPRVSAENREPGVLTVEEAERLLKHAERFGLLGFVCLGLFAGIRRAELARMDWSAVRIPDNEIVIDRSVAKTRSRRVIPIEETLMAWLQFCPKKHGPIVPVDVDIDHDIRHLKKAAGIQNWPHNGLRHSFASYHLAQCKDPQRTAYVLGHVGGTDVLHACYKGLVSFKDAERFWALRPPKKMWMAA